MIVAGRHPVLEALRSGREVREVLVAAGSHGLDEVVREAERRGIKVRKLARDDVARMAAGGVHQGVVAVVPAFAYAHLDEVLDRPRSDPLLLVALDGVTDPHNVGAVARSAEAAGAHGLLLPERRSAHVTPVVEKAAAGALSHLPVVLVGNLVRALEQLKQDGVWVVALDGAGPADVWDLDLATEPVCLVLGAEGGGVSRLVRDRSDRIVRIPMSGKVASLNVSSAAAVALFEVRRVRLARSGEGV